MHNLLIFPFNGNGLEALSCVPPSYRLLGFIDDTPEKQGKHPYGFEIYSRGKLENSKDASVLAVPGSSKNFAQRDQLITGLGLAFESFATLVSPRATISPLAKIGKNVLIMHGVVITANAVIGDHVVILPNTVIHHDVEIGDYTMIGSGVVIAGYSKIGRKCYIGSGSCIINNICVGELSLVGMGSNIIRDVSPASIMIGNPGRRL